jgi:hypothetical protein
MIKIAASVILMTASLYPAIADAGEAGEKGGARQPGANHALRVADGGRERRGFEAAVDGVLRHFDAEDYAALAAEMSSAAIPPGIDINATIEMLKKAAATIDAESGRRFAAIDLYASAGDAEVGRLGQFATLSHLRSCGGRICEEQITMRQIDGRWRFAGFHLYASTNPGSGKNL